MQPDNQTTDQPVSQTTPTTPVDGPVPTPASEPTPPAAPTSPIAAETTPVAPALTVTHSSTFPRAMSKKKLLIIAAAVVAVLLVGGSAGALWWTSPQKAYDDATSLRQAIPRGGEIKGSFVVTPDNGPDVTTEFTTQFGQGKSLTDAAIKMNAGVVNFNLTASVATSPNKSIYFKVNDVRKTITSFAGSSAAAVEQYYGGLIEKIDGKWVEMTADDITQSAKSSGADATCTFDTISKMTRDASYLDDISKIYDTNKYLSIKETLPSEKVNGHDSNHYVLAIDEAKLKSFGKAMESSKLFNDLKKCNTNQTAADTTTATDSVRVTKFELWVDKWTHRMTKLMVSEDASGSAIKLTMSVNYNDAQNVTTPKADTQFKEIQEEIKAITNASMQSGPSELDLNSI